MIMWLMNLGFAGGDGGVTPTAPVASRYRHGYRYGYVYGSLILLIEVLRGH